MTRSLTTQCLARSLQVALLAAVVCGRPVLAVAAAPSAFVVGVQSTPVADLVMFNAGFDAGLRQGMLCRILRGQVEVAEVLIVDLRPSCSAALITNVAARQTVRAGDSVQIKTVKS